MKEIVIVLGLPWSKKIKYAVNTYPTHQLVSPFSIRKAMERKGVYDPNSIFLFIDLVARSLMISNRPVVIIEESAKLEAIFIWKEMAVEYDYNIKCIIFDAALEKCFLDAENQDEETLKIISDKSKEFEQLKEVLNMKYQIIIDDVTKVKSDELIKSEDKEDEVL